MHALYVVFPVLCILAIAYRYYSAFIATKVMMLDDSRITRSTVRSLKTGMVRSKSWMAASIDEGDTALRVRAIANIVVRGTWTAGR